MSCPPLRLGEIVYHDTLKWSSGLRVIGLTVGIDEKWSANVTDVGGGGFWIFPVDELEKCELSNGTKLQVCQTWVITRLPNGQEVHAHPREDQADTAMELGYGTDIEAMTRDHDPLHSRLMDWLKAPYSYSLMLAAGCDVDRHIAGLEEEAVMAVQKLKKALP